MSKIFAPTTLTRFGASLLAVSFLLAETTTSSRFVSLGVSLKFSSLLVSCFMVTLSLWAVYPMNVASMTNVPSGRFFKKKWPVLSVVVAMVVPFTLMMT